MKSAMEMVAEFHRKHRMPHSDVPRVTEDGPRRILRLALLREEVDELMDGLGLSEAVGCEGELEVWGPPDETAVADALADITYLTIGAAVEWGIPLDRVFAEVDVSWAYRLVLSCCWRGSIIRRPARLTGEDNEHHREEAASEDAGEHASPYDGRTGGAARGEGGFGAGEPWVCCVRARVRSRLANAHEARQS